METTTIYKIKPFSAKIFCDVPSSNRKFDPYLVIRYGSSSFYTSVSKNTGKFPYWNDSFSFRKNGEEKIAIECWDYNVEFVSEKNAYLGKGVVDQSKCLPDKKTLLWISIERPKESTEEQEKTCELLIEIELSSAKKPEEIEVNEEDIEKEVMILEEIKGNENVIPEQKEPLEFNYQQPKVYAPNLNGNIIKMHSQHPSIHTSQRTGFPGMIAQPKVVRPQNFGNVINVRHQNPNMMVYHQPQPQPQIQYSYNARPPVYQYK